MHPTFEPDQREIETSFIPPMDRIERKVARLRTLLDMGGTMENKGDTLHVHGLRIDVAGLADMDEAVWTQVRSSIADLISFDQKAEAPRE